MRCAVVGHPVAHSLSPAIHRAAYQLLGLEWSYQAIDVKPGAQKTTDAQKKSAETSQQGTQRGGKPASVSRPNTAMGSTSKSKGSRRP